MQNLVEFLVISLKTLDGNRDSAKNYIFNLKNKQEDTKSESNLDKLKRFIFN